MIWSSPHRSGDVHSPRQSPHARLIFCCFALACLWVAFPALAYIGPGAGVALVSSFAVILVTLVLAVLAILLWPLRMAWRSMRRKKRDKAVIKRFIVVGLDGQDPRITDRLMAEGKLPNFQKLADQGGYHRLRTTFPSISPVAWSSFSTGTEPGKHNIFDFLDRDKRTYLPQLSSTSIGTVKKFFKLGRWRIPMEKPELRLLRRSKPFWTILGEYDIWSTVLRVPITFPPDEFYGAELSAMCVPDLLGTQGTFLLYTTRQSDEEFKEGGLRFTLEGNGPRFTGSIQGPPNSFLDDEPPLTVPMTLEVDRDKKRAVLEMGGESHTLEVGVLSPWITLTFPAAPMVKVTGICRMQLTEAGEHVSLYITPIALDPENPAMPVSHPSYYSTYLAKKIGPFSTLGLAEDTWALNEHVIDDGTFLKQSYDIDKEREEMFFAALEKLRTGTLSCVFDATDRIQHMFWRYMEDGHPAAEGIEAPEHANAIEELYKHNDALVGRVMEKVEEGDVLLVISDHGFTSFRRGVNLNAWLLQEGYLKLKDGTDGSSEWLRDVDWSQTKAYVLGLAGMFLNIKGREEEGIVDPSEVQALKDEIAEKLRNLPDAEKDAIGVNEMFDTGRIYRGPYRVNAPDFIVGYNEGYRTSWDCATGMVSGPIFEDNVKAWSGDHCIDPRLVPGVLFSNHPLDDADDPGIVDIAPTVLRLFGVQPPQHMDGKPLFERSRFNAKAAAKPATAAAG